MEAGSALNGRMACGVKEIFTVGLVIFSFGVVLNGELTENRNGTHHGTEDLANNGTEGHEGNETEVERYQIAKLDFEGVAQPYIISLWIVIASAAKIGELFIFL